ncbi:MAG: hypothetical protein R6V85_06730 [Polyangia bacterium]
MRRRLTPLALLAGAAVLIASAFAAAFDQHVSSTLWAEGYSVPGEGDELIRRRRIVEDLRLSAWNLLEGSGDPYYRGPRISIDLSLRVDTDLGVERAESRPAADLAYVPGLRPVQFDLLWANVDLRGLWRGALDLRVGRQLRIDTLGLFSFDGVETAVHLPIDLSLSTWIGYEVRGGHELGYSDFELDGVDNGGRRGLEADRYPYRERPRPRMAIGTELAWTPVHWVDAALAVRTVGISEPVSDQRVGGRLALGGRPVLASGRVVWSPLLDRQDDFSAAMREGTILSEADAELRVEPLDALAVSAEYTHYRPTFEADSIFNVFDLQPRDDLGARLEVRPVRDATLATWGFARLAAGSAGPAGNDEDAALSGVGGGVGGNWRRGSSRLSARVSGLREWGESRVGAEIGGGRGFFSERLWLGLRASAWHIGSSFSPALSGDVAGYVASARFRIAKGAEVLGEVENYFGGGRDPRVAVLALLQLDLWR